VEPDEPHFAAAKQANQAVQGVLDSLGVHELAAVSSAVRQRLPYPVARCASRLHGAGSSGLLGGA
jgi:hypothetical protein